jgi:hypothetical protein
LLLIFPENYSIELDQPTTIIINYRDIPMKTLIASLCTLATVSQADVINAEGNAFSFYPTSVQPGAFLGAEGATDEKKLGMAMNYKVDAEIKTKWTREDNPTLWYVDALGIKAEVFTEIVFVFDVIFTQWQLVLPFNLVDISPIEGYLLSSDENELYCFGMFYYFNFFNVVPYMIENWMNCHFSIIGRILAAASVSSSFLNTRAFATSAFSDLFECDAARQEDADNV